MVPVPAGNAGPVFLHPLTDVLLVVIGFRSAFRGGTDFLFDLIWEVSILSFILHSEFDFLINSRIGRNSKGKSRISRAGLHPTRLTDLNLLVLLTGYPDRTREDTSASY